MPALNRLFCAIVAKSLKLSCSFVRCSIAEATLLWRVFVSVILLPSVSTIITTILLDVATSLSHIVILLPHRFVLQNFVRSCYLFECLILFWGRSFVNFCVGMVLLSQLVELQLDILLCGCSR